MKLILADDAKTELKATLDLDDAGKMSLEIWSHGACTTLDTAQLAALLYIYKHPTHGTNLRSLFTVIDMMASIVVGLRS